MARAHVLLLNPALGPLDYRADPEHIIEPGSIVLAPLGPRQLVGVIWEEESLPSADQVGDNRLRPLLGVYDVPPIAAPLRRLIEWTSDYYLAPPAAVLRMALPSSSALDGSRTITEYRVSGEWPGRMTPQRAQALDRIGQRQGLIRELATIADVSEGVIRGLVKSGAIEAVTVSIDTPWPMPDPDHHQPARYYEMLGFGKMKEDQSDQDQSQSMVEVVLNPCLIDRQHIGRESLF